ncbi:dihydroorotase [Hydromonas duriensis]|uniref:Dihydroorotase n=1 Tax=Hydromonas duriensis TaxID=1527608 RepID=A0A4R6YAK9_9BURK|nr:dihydroorotase [Hydromonas duriensis]TDR32607.1 dihydroorotase [Hydromonas duriensis]
MTYIELIQPDDMHVHLRDGEALRAVVPDTARQFGRAVVMPNLKPPVTTVTMAREYRERIEAAVPADSQFKPLMTLYLTDRTSVEDVSNAAAANIVGFKLYPAGATTNSEAGVTSLDRCTAVLDMMSEMGIPLLVHGEVTHADVDIFDREAVFIDQVLIPLRKRHPKLKIVLEHITTRQAAEYVATSEEGIAATITAHHLLYNRNAMLVGGIRPHYYCLPILKRESHREALVAAATSGASRFFLGTDSAPHAQPTKEAECGCAGCYTALHAMELYATAFEQAGALDKLEGFSSIFGAQFYGLPLNTRKIRLAKETWTIPKSLSFTEQPLVPLNSGETLGWRFAGLV